MRRFDEGTTGRDIDYGHDVSRAHARRHNSVIFDATPARCTSTIQATISHKGFHCRAFESNFSNRVLPDSPRMRIAYCAVRRPRMYKLPDDEVPRALNVRMSLDPSLIGSSPGGEPAGSIGGKPGSVPKSMPVN